MIFWFSKAFPMVQWKKQKSKLRTERVVKVVKKRRRRKLKRSIKIAFIIILLLMIGGSVLLLKKEKKKEETKTYRYTYQESVFPDNVFTVPVYTELIDENTSARPTTKRIIKYIVLHETDNYEEGVGAKNHANYLKYNNDSSTSWHYTVDDHEIYHHIPDDEVAHHAKDDVGNQYGIGIELCVNSDGDFETTFENGAKLVAYLLKSYHLSMDSLKTHHDFSGKDCPHLILENHRLEEFKNRVKYYLSL